MSEHINLLPCPFCGGKAEIAIGEHNFYDAKIRCSNCSAEGPLFDDNYDRELNQSSLANTEEAAKHWNSRSNLTEEEKP